MALNTIAIDCYRFKYVIPISGVLQLGLTVRALACSVGGAGGPGFEPYSCTFFDYIIEEKVFEKILSSNATVY